MLPCGKPCASCALSCHAFSPCPVTPHSWTVHRVRSGMAQNELPRLEGDSKVLEKQEKACTATRKWRPCYCAMDGTLSRWNRQLFHSAAAGGRICWESAVLSGWIFSGRSLGRADGLSFSRIAWKVA